MPQRCRGMACPGGGLPRPCIFAADGKGGASRVGHRRDGLRCALCCPRAFGRACGSRLEKRHITKRVKGWKAMGSPVYEAAFAFGMLGLLLAPGLQGKFRRRAGERPKFDKKMSWAHKKQARLRTLQRGKPIPAAPELNGPGLQFFQQCSMPFDTRPGRRVWLAWVGTLRFHVRRCTKYPNAEPAPADWRRKWWQVRRELQKLLAPAVEKGPPFPEAVDWAISEGIFALDR